MKSVDYLIVGIFIGITLGQIIIVIGGHGGFLG